MIGFSNYVNQIKAEFKKEQIKAFNLIEAFESIQLASMGHNDTEGYQIFTPDFIVKDMCQAIGPDIFDSSKTILEPTSGDGAFTTYILQKRLEKITKNFEIESLRALSTIYSIEMDKELIEKQRNNIFTLVKHFVVENKIEVDTSYFDILRCIIVKNLMWAMSNTQRNEGLLFGIDVAYKMTEAEKGNLKPLDMPVWEINEKEINVHEEGIKLWMIH